jgi:uncharacterized Zn finger protein (UPF0148 family)
MTWKCNICGSDRFRGYKDLCGRCYSRKRLENSDARVKANEQSKRWREKNPKRFRDMQDKWRKNNKERTKFILAKSLLKGLTSEQRRELFSIYREE